MAGMFDDLVPAAQGTTPSPVPPSAAASAVPMFADLLPNAGHTSSGDHPLTVHGGLRPSPEIEVDIHNPQAIKEAIQTLDPDQTPGMGASLARGALAGATLNFGDELRGLAAAGGNPLIPGSQILGGIRMAGEAIAPDTFGHTATDRYNQAVSQARADDEIAQRANPGSYFAGEMAGGLAALPVAPELAPFKAAEGASLLARGGAALGNMATSGAVYGAAAGVGGAQDNLTDRLAGGAQGAILGAALNPAIGSVANTLSGTTGKAVGIVRRDLLARNNPQRLADEIIAQKIGQDARSPQDLIEGMTDAPAPVMVNPKPGNPAFEPYAAIPQGAPAPSLRTAADVGGANLQKLAGSVVRGGGDAENEARALLNARQFGDDTIPSQGDRVQAAVTKLMGGQSLASDAAEQIIARRSAQAAPAYEAARNTPIDYETKAGQMLLADLERVPQAARANANAILQVSDKGGHQMIYRLDPASGQMELATAPNVRQWDYIKQGLDQMIDGHTDALTGRVDTLGYELIKLKGELLAQLDKLVPAYGNARKIFAGHSETLKAMQQGLEAFKPSVSPAEMTKTLAALHSLADKDAYKLAAAKGLKDRLSNIVDAKDKAAAISSTPNLRAKIAVIAKDEASRMQLMRFVQNEKSMTLLRNKTTGGSPTAERMSGDSALTEGMDNLREGIHAAHNVAHMNIAGLMLQAVRHLQKISPEKREAVLNEVRKVILNPDPSALRSFEDRIQSYRLAPETRRPLLEIVRSASNNSTTVAVRAALELATQRSSTPRDAQAKRLSPPSMR